MTDLCIVHGPGSKSAGRPPISGCDIIIVGFISEDKLTEISENLHWNTLLTSDTPHKSILANIHTNLTLPETRVPLLYFCSNSLMASWYLASLFKVTCTAGSESESFDQGKCR